MYVHKNLSFEKEGTAMKTNWITAFGLLAVAILLFINFVTTFFQPGNVFAENKNDIGRYEISAWASPSKGVKQFSGYYIIDTTTGKVVDKRTERLSVGD
jgi:hypothetical protein